MSQAAPQDLLLDALDKLVHYVDWDNATADQNHKQGCAERVARIWIRHHKEIRQMLTEN